MPEHKTQNTTEQQILGPHTFDTWNDNTRTQAPGIQENRQLFIERCMNTKTKAINTWFEKPDEKKLHIDTWRQNMDHHGQEPHYTKP